MLLLFRPYRVTLSNINAISANVNPNQQQAAPARQATPARPAAPAQQARAAPTNPPGPVAQPAAAPANRPPTDQDIADADDAS
ncbi:Uncharacterized protein HZ326_30748 [Fusarium oxysporum f. sp. albedinis]|nr:Uncharacterized protein HZ326_30748 [Fusarium oxysporum f. sp. albedinis]